MVTAAWDTSNLVALYKDGKQCTSCCTPPRNHEEICCWCAANPPLKITMIIRGVTSCPGKNGAQLNGTWILDFDIDSCDFGGDPAIFSCQFSYEDANVRIFILWDTLEYGISAYTIEGGNTYPVFGGYSYCEGMICASDIANSYTAGLCGIGPDPSGYGGFASWRPYEYVVWVLSEFYAVDVLVTNNDIHYICIQVHTSDITNEPGVGGAWMAYWEEVTC